MSEWIDSSKEFPKEGEIIDVWDKVHQTRIPDCRVLNGEVVSSYIMWSGIFSHWMLKPEPPKENNNE